MSSPPTVFHADPDGEARTGLAVLCRSARLPVEGFETGAQLLAVCRPERAGCLVLEARLPDQSGLDLLGCCGSQGIFLPVVFLAADASVPVAVEAMKRGAVDFLLKPCDERALLDGVRQALAVDAHSRPERARHQRTARLLALLKPGERNVLGRMLAGLGYKTIASELAISVKTVEVRRSKIMDKLGCETLAELLELLLSYRFWRESRPAWEVEEIPELPG
jgi:FixJ family two-component response regulator